jgi:hypothetical protein
MLRPLNADRGWGKAQVKELGKERAGAPGRELGKERAEAPGRDLAGAPAEANSHNADRGRDSIAAICSPSCPNPPYRRN